VDAIHVHVPKLQQLEVGADVVQVAHVSLAAPK